MTRTGPVPEPATLRDGSVVDLVPMTPADAERLVRFHSGLSAETVYRRFFSVHPELSADELYLVDAYIQVRRAGAYHPYQRSIADSLLSRLGSRADGAGRAEVDGHDPRMRRTAEAAVRDASDRDLSDGGMGGDRDLDFARIHLVAAPVDDVVLARNEEHVSVVVDVTHVTGPEPPVGIRGEVVVRSRTDLADPLAVGIFDAEFAGRHGPTDRPQPLGSVVKGLDVIPVGQGGDR